MKIGWPFYFHGTWIIGRGTVIAPEKYRVCPIYIERALRYL